MGSCLSKQEDEVRLVMLPCVLCFSSRFFLPFWQGRAPLLNGGAGAYGGGGGAPVTAHANRHFGDATAASVRTATSTVGRKSETSTVGGSPPRVRSLFRLFFGAKWLD